MRNLAQSRAVEVIVDRFVIPLPNGRSLSISTDQLRRVARGLGESHLALATGRQEPPIVSALLALPPGQRGDALNVVLRRFADKQDVETIAQTSGLTPWQVWQLEESFHQALLAAQPVAVGRFVAVPVT
jgi:hypothetical protein